MARFSDDFLERLNEATDIVAVVGEHVKLRKAGAEFKGLCPFHNEKTPSFGVNPAKGVFTCRGCGEKGNAAQFLTKLTGQNFRDVVNDLAQRANMPVPQNSSPMEDRQASEIARLTELLQRADRVYREQLRNDPKAMAYLADRGVTPAMIERFGIGYAPGNGRALRQALTDVREADLIAAGLAFKSEFRKGEVMEYMRDRITFPIGSSSGKTVAFGGRILQDNNSGPKYLNTPETLVFKKSAQLFGLHQASNAIRKSGQVVVVEGYLDVVVPSGHGVENVVSPMGTAFSTGSLNKLFGMAEQVVFCFDGDKAGRTAAFKALEISAQAVDDKHRTSYAFLPEGKDPDVFVLDNGPDALRELVRGAEPMSKFLIREFSSRNDLTYAEGKAKFASDTMQVIERIQAPTLKALMIEDVRGVLGPNIPLPGVTPGVPAVQPEPLVEPARSGFRAFKERAAAAARAAASIPGPSLNPKDIQSGHAQAPSDEEPAISATRTLLTAHAVSPSPAYNKIAARAGADHQPAPIAEASTEEGAASTPQAQRKLGFRSARSMVATSREQDFNVVPTPALRMLAFVLRDPQIAAFVTPNEAAYLEGAPGDVDALQAACAAMETSQDEGPEQEVRSERLAAGPAEQRQAILETIKGTNHEAIAKRAMGLPEFLAQDMNVGEECAAIMRLCAKRAQRRVRLGMHR